MNRRFLRFHAVKERAGYGHTSIYEMMRNGEFPKPYPLGARAVGWLEEEIEQWISERIKARDE